MVQGTLICNLPRSTVYIVPHHEPFKNAVDWANQYMPKACSRVHQNLPRLMPNPFLLSLPSHPSPPQSLSPKSSGHPHIPSSNLANISQPLSRPRMPSTAPKTLLPSRPPSQACRHGNTELCTKRTAERKQYSRGSL